MVRVALFGALENRPSVNAVIALARNDVDMEMRYRLTCAFIACVEQVHAVVAAVVDKVTGNLLHGIHHVVQRIAVAVKNIFEVLLRNDEDMSVNVVRDIHDGNRCVVFVQLAARKLSLEDFAKYTVHIVCLLR